MKKKLIIGGFVLAIIVVIVSINIAKSKSMGAFSGGKAIEVNVVEPRIEDINATIDVNGIVEEADKEEIYFDSVVRVARVLVSKEQTVRKGQKLVELDLDDLESQLNQSRVSLNIQKISLEKIKDSLKQQSTVRAQNDVEQAKTALEQAKKNYERVKELYVEGAASKLEYENAKIQYDNTTLQYESAQVNLKEINRDNEDAAKNSQKDIQNQVEQIKLAEFKIQDLETKIGKLKKQSISPIDGIVTELNVEDGSMTNPSVKAMKIININSLQIKLEVKEIDVLKVKGGQQTEVTGDAFPDKIIKGFVKTIGAVATKKQSSSNSDEAFVEVIVRVEDGQKALKPGLSVNAKIITKTKNKAVVIPFNTFQEDKDARKWVFAVEDNNMVKQKYIEVGISSGLDLEVVKGLNGNEKLVQDPSSRLKDGMKATIQATQKK